MSRKRRTKKELKTKDENPYIILGVNETASVQEIKRAYLERVRLSPPEKDPEGFKSLRKAYEVLKDSSKRKMLDFSIFRTAYPDRKSESRDDLITLFKNRVFGLLVSQSDFYLKDFSDFYMEINEDVRMLK